MTRYRLFGSHLSPYSIKVRSYFRYKGIDHEWLVRSMDRMAEFQKYARLPLVPLVITPDGQGIQDSSPIIERLEDEYPEPGIHPEGTTSRFVSALLEEYGDEWVNKPMFHYRWTAEVDRVSASRRLAADILEGAEEARIDQMVPMLSARMVGRLPVVGSNAANEPLIARSFSRLLGLLDEHLASRAYLFGGRPAFADFGLFAQLHQAATDPTPGGIMRRAAPNVLAWLERMLSPTGEGPFEPWDVLAPTLMPILRDEVAGLFLPWSVANADALAQGSSQLEVTLDGAAFAQTPQKYHAKSLGWLRDRYRAIPAGDDKDALASVLAETGCLAWIAP